MRGLYNADSRNFSTDDNDSGGPEDSSNGSPLKRQFENSGQGKSGTRTDQVATSKKRGPEPK